MWVVEISTRDKIARIDSSCSHDAYNLMEEGDNQIITKTNAKKREKKEKNMVLELIIER